MNRTSPLRIWTACLLAVPTAILLGASVTRAESEPALLAPGFFPILPWDPQHGWHNEVAQRRHGLDSIAACGFTVAGFVQPADLPACEKLGLKAIIAPPRDGEPWAGPWRQLNDEQIEARVRTMIERAGASPAIAGYFLTDEPGTPSFPALGKAVAAVKKYAPGKLAYINLFPGYATIGAPDTSQLGAASFTDYLQRYVAEVKPQFISYDNYMVQFSDDLADKAKAALYFSDLLEVRRVALKHGLPFWNIVSSNQIRPETPPPSPVNLMLQAFTTLAAGGRGVSWYTYYGGIGKGYAYAPIHWNGSQTETWRYLKLVNEQLKTVGPVISRLKSTAVYFSSPALLEKATLLPGRIVQTLQSRASRRSASEPSLPAMVGEFIGEDGLDYVMVVNLSLHRSANITLATHKPYATKTALSAMDGRWVALDEKNGHWLTAGQGVLIKLQSSPQ